MIKFDMYDVKKRIKELRTNLNVSKLKLEEKNIISCRQLQRVENLEDKTFLSLFKLIDLANFFNVPIDYLLGTSDDLKVNNVNTYRQLFQYMINIFDTKLVEFDVNQSSTSFFCIKSCDKVVIEFFTQYKKILDIKPSIDKDVYDKVLDNLLDKFNNKIK